MWLLPYIQTIYHENAVSRYITNNTKAQLFLQWHNSAAQYYPPIHFHENVDTYNVHASISDSLDLI